MTVLEAGGRHQELIEELISDVATYNEGVDKDLLRRAFSFAAERHAGQQRRSGEDFIHHPWGRPRSAPSCGWTRRPSPPRFSTTSSRTRTPTSRRFARSS